VRWLPWAGPAMLLAAALLELPYGYYQLLRVAIFLISIFHLKLSLDRSEERWAWTFGTLAMVYNPIVPLALGRTIWTGVNLVTIMILLLHWRHCAHLDPKQAESPRS
jgi:hypothetical protein